MKKLLLSSVLSLAFATGLFAAPHTFSVSSVNGGAAAGSPKLNLDNLALGNATQVVSPNLSISFIGDGGVVTGTTGTYAAPFVSGSNGIGFGSPDQPNGADTTKYLTTGIGSIVFSFTSLQNYFGLLWGSVDGYNSLAFYNGNEQVGYFTGNDVWANANGDQGANGTYYVNFTDLSGHFDTVVAKSTQYAFEIDNIAHNNHGGPSVPDTGSTAALLGLAIAGIAAVRRKR